MTKKTTGLRAVESDERQAVPPTLSEAVTSGNVLDMLKAQRRLVADALLAATDSVKPQLNNELNKLHRLIAEEEHRSMTAKAVAEESRGDRDDAAFDASAV